MTVSYSLDYATSGYLTYLKLLFRWKASIYKLLWLEALVYFGVYFLISASYRLLMTDEQRTTFERVALYCEKYVAYIPLSWILGFYVNLVVSRFTSTYSSLAWPDATMFYLGTYAPGNEESVRIFRRTVARLMSLANVVAMRDVSTSVRKRFPTMEHIINAGFMTDEEYIKFETLNCPHPKFWMIMQWAMDLVTQAYDEGKIKSERYMIKIHEEIMKYRASIGTILSLDWISMPLVYTQVVTIAVKSFFMACLIGRQFLQPRQLLEKYTEPAFNIDIYFPVFTFLQYVFYAGWLKVAESLINPLGEDDDDFELNYLIDRNLQLSYLIVDKNCYEKPTIAQDVHWDQDLAEIAHTEASSGLKTEPEVGSAVPITVTGAAAEQFLPSERSSRQPSIAGSIQSLNKRFGSGLANSFKRKFSSSSSGSGHSHKRSLPLRRLIGKHGDQARKSSDTEKTEEGALLGESETAPLAVLESITEVPTEVEKRAAKQRLKIDKI